MNTNEPALEQRLFALNVDQILEKNEEALVNTKELIKTMKEGDKKSWDEQSIAAL